MSHHVGNMIGYPEGDVMQVGDKLGEFDGTMVGFVVGDVEGGEITAA